VHAAEPLDRSGDQLLQFGDLAHVGIHPDRLVPQRPDLFLERLGRFGMSDIIDHDIGPLLGELQHDREADAAVSAGDDGGFAFQVHDPSPWLMRVDVPIDFQVRDCCASTTSPTGARALSNAITASVSATTAGPPKTASDLLP